MSYAWDRMTKKFIKDSIDRWRMRLEKLVERGGGLIVHLILEPNPPTLHPLDSEPSTPLLLIKNSRNMKDLLSLIVKVDECLY